MTDPGGGVYIDISGYRVVRDARGKDYVVRGGAWWPGLCFFGD